MKTGKCSSVVEARLLRFWEARNVKRDGDLSLSVLSLHILEREKSNIAVKNVGLHSEEGAKRMFDIPDDGTMKVPRIAGDDSIVYLDFKYTHIKNPNKHPILFAYSSALILAKGVYCCLAWHRKPIWTSKLWLTHVCVETGFKRLISREMGFEHLLYGEARFKLCLMGKQNYD
ncbi:hypothetical protein YC2023_109003 [Brassica napus]